MSRKKIGKTLRGVPNTLEILVKKKKIIIIIRLRLGKNEDGVR